MVQLDGPQQATPGFWLDPGPGPAAAYITGLKSQTPKPARGMCQLMTPRSAKTASGVPQHEADKSGQHSLTLGKGWALVYDF